MTMKLSDGREPKLPDAIHVVTAVGSGCQVFLSADDRIQVPAGLTMVEPDLSGISTLLRELP
jgi:hypothetical protein